MKLLTHNMLQCHVRGCNQNSFPLAFTSVELELAEVDFNPAFVERLVTKVDWPALVETATALGLTDSIPKCAATGAPLPPKWQPEAVDADSLKELHHLLLEVKVKSGEMACKNCGHVYIVKDFIPNMLLQDDEV